MDSVETISANDKIDKLEQIMQDYPSVTCELNHDFFPGLYVRQIIMKAGSLITSLIHKTTHPFYVMQGAVSVFSENNGEQFIIGPHRGTTTPNTRRVLYIHENCVWETAHSISWITGEENDLSDEEKEKVIRRIEDQIIEKRENPLLGGMIKNNIISQLIGTTCPSLQQG